jgi:hypothetical protein
MWRSGWKRSVIGALAGLSIFAGVGHADATTTLICRGGSSVSRLEIDDGKVVWHLADGSSEIYVNGRAHANEYHSENTCTEFVQVSAQRYEFGLRCKNETTDLVSPAVRYRLDRYTGYFAQLTPTVQGLDESDHAQCERASSGPQL